MPGFPTGVRSRYVRFQGKGTVVRLFFIHDTATTEIYTLSLHDALPIFVAAIVLSASTSSWADGQPKRVLMLHSFGLRFKPWTDYAEQIRTEIGRWKSVDFHDHSLLGARVDDPKSEGPFIAYLSALNADQPPDLNGDRGTRRKLCAAAPQRSLSKCSNGPHCRRAAEGRPQQAHRERHSSGNVQ